MEEKTLGETLQEIRKNKNVTVARLSEHTGVNQVHLNLIESGKRLPSGELLEKMSELFNVNEKLKESLYLLLVKEKLKNNIPDKIIKKLTLGKEGMPDNFIERIKTDIKNTKTKIDKKKIDAVLDYLIKLSKEEVIELAESLKQPAADYLLLAEYIPDEFIELMRYKDAERLIKGITGLDDDKKIEKAVKSLADFISVTTKD
ncbi:MAG: helix-turn-helix domain-containing protein [Deltaproteobacteria bacterium]|nr:helix-turn-helix domain-containing protein [Deltaproteobacteria bacterium]